MNACMGHSHMLSLPIGPPRLSYSKMQLTSTRMFSALVSLSILQMNTAGIVRIYCAAAKTVEIVSLKQGRRRGA